jgi:hypothetical protein
VTAGLYFSGDAHARFLPDAEDIVYAHGASRRPKQVQWALMLDRLCCFVEEFTAHCLQTETVPGITITELPLGEAPERFRLTLGTGGLPRWKIAYHASLFEDT